MYSRMDVRPANLRPLTDVSTLLHCIRATVQTMQRTAVRHAGEGMVVIEARLATLLMHALLADSAFDIAVTLGCGAEFSIFPEAVLLERCAHAVNSSELRAARGVVWAVRHRSRRSGPLVRRFTLPDLANAGACLQKTYGNQCAGHQCGRPAFAPLIRNSQYEATRLPSGDPRK